MILLPFRLEQRQRLAQNVERPHLFGVGRLHHYSFRQTTIDIHQGASAAALMRVRVQAACAAAHRGESQVRLLEVRAGSHDHRVVPRGFVLVTHVAALHAHITT